MQIGQILFSAPRFVAEFRESDKIYTNYAEFARLYITQHELHKIRMIRAELGSTACQREDSLKCVDCTNFASLASIGGG